MLVAAWVGSTNLGDELVFAGLSRRLAARGARVTAISVDPASTSAVHGVSAVSASDPRSLWAAAGRADAVVFGGGGLLQDETSPFNLPYHLGRTLLAALRRTPWAGVGLGAGRLDTALGRGLVRTALRRAVAVSVRDRESAELLQGLGLAAPVVAADLALSLPPPEVEARDRLVVCLRPWAGRRGRLPAAARARVAGTPEHLLQATARALDECASTTGLAVHLVALQPDRDGPLHEAIAARMAAPATTATPGVHNVVAEVATGRAVVAMRYHGGIAAALGGRPSVLVGYSPKVDALARDLEVPLLRWSADGPSGLASAVHSALGTDVRPAVARLRERERGNDEVLDRLLSRSAGG